MMLKIIVLLILVVTSAAYAKDVFIEWSPTPGAERYEVVVEQNGKNIVKTFVTETKWKGDLTGGTFIYRLRSIDKFKRAGQWSEAKALVVLPPSPSSTTPSSGGKVRIYNPRASIPLQWSAIEGANKYHIIVKHDGRVFHDVVVTGTSTNVPAPPPGEYSWTVSSVVTVDGRAPASVAGKSVESSSHDAGSFTIEPGELAAPKIIFPIGPTFPPGNSKLKFSWEAVEGAEAYEILIFKLSGRVIASGSPTATLFAKDNSLEVKMPKKGRFRWEVRALANIDASRKASSTGPKSEATFEFDRNAVFKPGGYVAISTMLAPYTYKIISPVSGLQGSFNSALVNLRLSGEYFPWLQWGFAAAVETTSIRVQSVDYRYYNAEFYGKYRINFSSSKYGWYFNPKVGAEYRQYPELRPTSSRAITPIYVGAVGPSVGADLRKQFTDSFSVGIRAAYFFPVILFGSDSSTPTADASYRNLNVGAQLAYWLGGHWALAAGLFYDQRSISYQASKVGVTKPQQVYVDGTYFFGSILFSF